MHLHPTGGRCRKGGGRNRVLEFVVLVCQTAADWLPEIRAL